MEKFKQTCRDMSIDRRILTFSEIGRAAAKGALIGQKANTPVLGAILGVSLEAGLRAVKISEDLLSDLSHATGPAAKPKSLRRIS